MLRFAPAPTGDMYLGDLRVAILNYIVAQQEKDNFLIRIQDTNKEHNIEGKDTEIMMILEKFALKHDSVYHQTEHLNLHQTLALRLLKEKKAFICKCVEKDNEDCQSGCQDLTQDEYTTLKNSGEPFVVRVKQPNSNIIYQDLFKGIITTEAKDISSFIILNRDSTPSEEFATACDDMLSDVGFIICKDNELKNRSKEIYIQNLLEYDKKRKYAHLPAITNDSDVTIKSLFEQGFIPDAILNYLILLDNPNASKEIFTLPEAIEWFKLENISKEPIEFNISKLRYINQEHLKLIDDKLLSTLFGFADADIGKLAKLYLEECSTINELKEKIQPIFKPKSFEGEYADEMKLIADIIFNAPAFETFEKFKQHIIKESNLEEATLLKALRYLLTAQGNGPELSEIYPLIKSYILEVAS